MRHQAPIDLQAKRKTFLLYCMEALRFAYPKNKTNGDFL